ncbi:MAG: DUF4162 domain-containing protein [Deltaproteobacteria bacterium]|nr:DUF4162 domain-containing protein [Deltaproteobacteria bacterium]
MDETAGTWKLRFSLDSDDALLAVLQAARDRGLRVVTFAKLEPGLEDLFIKIVGRKLEDEE